VKSTCLLFAGTSSGEDGNCRKEKNAAMQEILPALLH
jgi:hypothetical protein